MLDWINNDEGMLLLLLTAVLSMTQISEYNVEYGKMQTEVFVFWIWRIVISSVCLTLMEHFIFFPSCTVYF